MQVHQLFVGVDVAKSTLSVCLHGTPGRRDLGNDEISIRDWLATLPAHASIAVESTGRYHQLVVRLAAAAGHRVFVLNAADVYFYAKALGARGKTDRSDAQIIARYLAEHHDALKPWAPGTAAQERVQQLLRCRAGVTSERMSLRQRLREVPGLDAAAQALERQFATFLETIDREIAALVAADSELSASCAALRTITGFGPQCSALFAALLGRLHFANADALVAYTGLDPRPNDSGVKTGRRRLSKRGDPHLRRQLHMAAAGAARSKALKPLYLSIKAKGFKPTEALVILARKLLRVAWAIWKSRKPFDPKRLGAPTAC